MEIYSNKTIFLKKGYKSMQDFQCLDSYSIMTSASQPWPLSQTAVLLGKQSYNYKCFLDILLYIVILQFDNMGPWVNADYND